MISLERLTLVGDPATRMPEFRRELEAIKVMDADRRAKDTLRP